MAGGGGRGALPAVMAREVPAPAAIPARAVAAAEVAADEVVRRVRPTEASERRRAEVIDYARTLVGAALGCEVFAFGSVPLKTYLPDGDIDLTVLGNTSYGSTLIDDLYFILGSEEQNTDAEFEVKESERIDAEVRLIKCTIENIIVDISFNQTGGICTLGFLELVDLKVGKNHLFKRSIILIKAWCYYESRLLGAHHGLISTYALETLILYIFNLFHKSLHGPLEVLYRFLEYFSKFDWENYCISLNGPVALSSLPNLIVETTDIPGDDLLFDKEFLVTSAERASVPLRDLDARSTRFRVKHLNIIDPLKECNNLGRSVNRANFNRIRTAFSYGARTLGQILVLSSEYIPDEIFRFFKNTLKRNGGVRPDISNDGYAGAFQCQPLLGPDKALLEDMSSLKISYKEDENGSPCCLSKSAHNNDSNMKINVPTQGACFPADPKLAPSSGLSTKSSHSFHHAPKQYSYFYRECGNGGNVGHKMEGHVYHCTAEALYVDDKSLMQPQVHSNNLSHVYSTRGTAFELRKHDHTNKTNQSVTLPHVEKQLPPFSILSLPDLSGDLDSQLRCLRQVQYHLEYLFDELLQSVQEASSDGKVEEDPSNTLTRSIFLNTEVTFPGPLSPSSTETDGRKSSPDTSSHSTEDFSQQSQDEDHWVAACQQNTCGTDVPSNGSSPSSYYASSESSISWCHISDGIPSMHSTGPYITKKHLGEKWKTLINQPVRIKDNHASVPNGGFVPYKEQVALDSTAREITISQTLRTGDGYIRSGRKTVEKQSGHTHKEYVKPYNNARQIRRHYGDVCSKDLFQKQGYGADMEFARPASIPKYQPMEIQDTSNECTYINNNSARRQIYGTRKGHAILDWPTNRRPICEPLKLESSRRGRGCFKRNLAAKQNNDDHNEMVDKTKLESISVVRDTGHISNGHAVTILNGSAKEFNPNKEMVENGSKPRPLLPNVLLSHDSGNNPQPNVLLSQDSGNNPQPNVLLSQDSGNNPQMLLPSNASQPSLHVTKGALETQPEGTIEFGSLGPFSLTCSSSKSNKARNTLSTSEASADASAFVLQRYRTVASQTRSPRFYRIGDEDHFPPLHAATR